MLLTVGLSPREFSFYLAQPNVAGLNQFGLAVTDFLVAQTSYTWLVPVQLILICFWLS